MMFTKVALVQSCDEGTWVGQKQCHSTKQAMARDSQSHHTSKKPSEVMKFSVSNTEPSRVNPVILLLLCRDEVNVNFQRHKNRQNSQTCFLDIYITMCDIVQIFVLIL